MSTDAISSVTATANATANATVSLGLGDLNSGSFLKLLTVQLRNQDPLNPMDPQAMLAQLAQFTSLQQAQELNEQMSASRQENTMAQGAALVGQNLHIRLQNGSEVIGAVQQVAWMNGTMTLQINGSQYSMGNIAAILPMPTPAN